MANNLAEILREHYSSISKFAYFLVTAISGIMAAKGLSTLLLQVDETSNNEGDGIKTDPSPYRPKVMVAIPDDDSKLRTRILNYLEERNYRLVIAGNGDEAVKKADEYSLDVIIASIQLEKARVQKENEGMPYEAIQQKNLESLKNVFDGIKRADGLLPTIFLTLKEPNELEFAANYDTSGGTLYLNDLRKEDTEISKSDLEKKVISAAGDIRDHRELLHSSIMNFIQEIKKPELKASEELGSWMDYIYFRMPQPSGRIVRFTDDSVEGGARVSPVLWVETLTPGKDYRQRHESVAYIVKKVPSMDKFRKYVEDFNQYGQLPDGFPLSEAVKYYEAEDGNVLVLFKMHLAATNGEVMKLLNTVKDENQRFAKAIIDAQVYIANEEAVKFFNRTKHEVDLSEHSISSSLEKYMERAYDAMLNVERYSDAKFSEGEKDKFREDVRSRFPSLIRESSSFWGRTLGNNPYNSGILGLPVRPSIESILNEFRDAYNTHRNEERVKETVRRKFCMWDQNVELNKDGKIEPRHLFEDLIHWTDSYEANREENDKIKDYKKFLGILLPSYLHVGLIPGPSRKLNDFWEEFFVMGFYKNWRKQGLATGEHMKNNEEEWMHFKLDNEEEYVARKSDYANKWRHYAMEAAKYAAIREIFCSDSSYLNRDFDRNAEQIASLMHRFKNGKLSVYEAEKAGHSALYRIAIAAANQNNRINFEAYKSEIST